MGLWPIYLVCFDVKRVVKVLKLVHLLPYDKLDDIFVEIKMRIANSTFKTPERTTESVELVRTKLYELVDYTRKIYTDDKRLSWYDQMDQI